MKGKEKLEADLYGPRNVKPHGRKERKKGNKIEARSIGRSKSSHFSHSMNIAVKALLT